MHSTPSAVPVVRTFLIADVRGYTRFTQEHGDEAAAALASSFAEIVGRVVAEYDGDLIELRGDEALVVFASARQALRAAVEVQRGCREQNPGLPLGVGIGLDAGEAVPLPDGGYRGGALNLAARLCSIAAPGQILASEGVVHLARKVEGLQYRPRRAERLKGIADRVKSVEVVPDVPLPPVPALAAQARSNRRTRWIVAGSVSAAALAAALVAFVLIGSGSSASSAIAANAAGLVDPHGHVVAEVPVSGRPAGVASAGSLWVTDSVNASLLRIDPKKRTIVDRIGVGANPGGVAVSPGSIWVANSDDGTVSRVDPATDNVVDTIRVGNGPTSVVYGGGSVWVLNSLDGTLTRLAPDTGRPTATIPLGQNPTRLAFGLGNVWVTSEEAGLLLRIDPAGNSVVQAVSVGNGPVGVAVGDNAVWVANTPDRTISRVDPTSGSVTKINLPDRPREVAYADGLLWASNTLDGTLTQIGTHSQKLERTIRTVEDPTALAADGRNVWTLALTSSAAHRGGTLRIAGGEGGDSSFDTPDPGATYRQKSWQMTAVVYDGLVTYRRTGGPSGGTIVPDLATALPVVQDGGATYVFKVRKGIRYSNGAPVRPSDLRSAIERQYRAQTGATGLIDIRGSRRCTKRVCDLSSGVVADDGSSTITIHLEAPDPDFLFKLALPFGSFLPRGSPQIGTDTPLPGTGPYFIKRYVPNRQLLLARNPYFHQWSADAQPAGYPNQIQYTFGFSQSAATSAIETGRADLALEATPAGRLHEIATRFSSLAHPFVEPETYYMTLNTKIAPFDDVRMRRALNLATDRQKLVELWGGDQLARPTCQVLPPGIAGYRPYCPYTAKPNAAGLWRRPDLAEARRLVAGAGGARGPVTIAVNRDDPVKTAIARYFAGLVAQLGFHPRLRLLPDVQSVYVTAGDPRTRTQLAFFGWHSDFPRASDFFGTLLTCASYQPKGFNLNAAGFCQPALDREIGHAQALASTDPAASAALWSRVDHEVVDAAPWIPFLNGAGLELTSRRVANYQRNPQFGVLIDQLWVR